MSLSDRVSNGILKVLRIFVNIEDVEYLSAVDIRSAIQHRSLTKYLQIQETFRFNKVNLINKQTI